MRKALYSIAAGWPITRSMAQFLIDCFDSGAQSSAVELFEDYMGFKHLLPVLRLSETSDRRGQARNVLVHYYIAVAQKTPEICSRIFKADFERLKRLDIFPEVVVKIYQLLQTGWLTNYHRIIELRKKSPPSRVQRYTFESFYNRDLTSNFSAILDLYVDYKTRKLWGFIRAVEDLLSINKSAPPPLCMRPQFISTFETVENLKRKINRVGPDRRLYISVEKSDLPVVL